MWTREQPPLQTHHPPTPTLHVDERAASTSTTSPTHPYTSCGRESSLHFNHTNHPPLHYMWTRDQPPLQAHHLPTHPLPYMWTREQPPLQPHHPPTPTLHVDERAASTSSTPTTHPYTTCGRENSLHFKHTTHPPLHFMWTREQPSLQAHHPPTPTLHVDERTGGRESSLHFKHTTHPPLHFMWTREQPSLQAHHPPTPTLHVDERAASTSSTPPTPTLHVDERTASTSSTPHTHPYTSCGRENSLHFKHTTHPPLHFMWTREQPPLQAHHPPTPTLHVDERAAFTSSTPPTHPYTSCGRESSLHFKHTTHPPLHLMWTREQPPLQPHQPPTPTQQVDERAASTSTTPPTHPKPTCGRACRARIGLVSLLFVWLVGFLTATRLYRWRITRQSV